MPMSKMLYLQEVLSLGQAGIVLATVSSWSIGVLDFSCKAALVQSLQPAADLSPPRAGRCRECLWCECCSHSSWRKRTDLTSYLTALTRSTGYPEKGWF